MGTSAATISKLREHQSATPSRWRENAEWRMKNRSWLRYSQRIAMMMLDKMEEMNMSQKQLSELMGCSQHIECPFCPIFFVYLRIFIEFGNRDRQNHTTNRIW